MPCSNGLLEVPCSNKLCKRALLGFLGFAHKLNDFGLFFGDSIILWPNFGSNMMSIFVEGPSWIICRI